MSLCLPHRINLPDGTAIRSLMLMALRGVATSVLARRIDIRLAVRFGRSVRSVHVRQPQVAIGEAR